MSILRKITLLVAFFSFCTAYADQWQLLDSAYEKGDIDYLREVLTKMKSSTQAEKEQLDYYQAITHASPDFIQDLQNIAEQAEGKYSQSANLELGKIAYLNKEYAQATKHLDKVTDPKLEAEKSYWLAYSQYSLADYKNAIYQAQNFLEHSLDNDKIESGYILLSDCYIRLGQHNLALEVLLSVEKLKLFTSQRAAALYNIALCYDKLKDEKKSKETTFLLKKEFPYSKYAQDVSRVSGSAQLTANYKPQGNFNPDSYLQVGAFQDNQNALETEQDLKDKGYRVKIHKELSGQSLLYKVWVGPLSTAQQANTAKQNLLAHNYPSFVVQPATKQETTTLSQKNYYLECGVFTDPNKLRQRLQKLKELGVQATAYKRQIGKNSFMYGVIGPFPNKEKALIQQQELKKHDLASNLFIK